jgi:hypothetical protein
MGSKSFNYAIQAIGVILAGMWLHQAIQIVLKI